MASFQCILRLIVLNGFVLPGLSLSSSPSTNPFKSHPPYSQRLHVTDQKQSEFPRHLDREVIVGFGRYSGKAEMEGLELDGETGEGHPGDGYSHLDTEEVSPGERVGNGDRRLVEGSKGQRWVKGKLGGNDDATVWGKTTDDVSTELLRKEKNDGETRRTEDENEKRKWGDNSMRVWGKRSPTETDKRKWGDNSMSVWGKRSEDGSEKRKWGDNSMSVWGKRSDNDKGSSGQTSTSGKANEAAENRGIAWVKQEKVDLAKNTGSSQGHRILHKRSILDRDENPVDGARYDWLVQELSKKSRPRLNSRGTQYGGPKRNWETNTMKVWGKRGLVWDTVPNWDDSLDEESKDLDGKRTWTSDNAIRVWGKRNSHPEANEIIVLPIYDQ